MPDQTPRQSAECMFMLRHSCAAITRRLISPARIFYVMVRGERKPEWSPHAATSPLVSNRKVTTRGRHLEHGATTFCAFSSVFTLQNFRRCLHCVLRFRRNVVWRADGPFTPATPHHHCTQPVELNRYIKGVPFHSLSPALPALLAWRSSRP